MIDQRDMVVAEPATSMLDRLLGRSELKISLKDALQTAKIVASKSWRRTIDAWVLVPIGVVAVMAICFGVDRLIGLSSVSFPASVACMILLFFGLILCSMTLGDRKTKMIVGYIDVPCGWSLRYINVFLTPGFVTLPLSPAISGVEVGKIIGVAVVGWAVVFVFTVWFVRGMVLMFGGRKKATITRAEEMGNEPDEIPMSTPRRSMESSSEGQRTPDETPMSSTPFWLQPPSRAQNPDAVTGTGGPPVADSSSQLLTETVGPTSILRHDALPRTRPEKWAVAITARLDVFTYAFLLIFIGIPTYYAADYAMPLQLILNILTYQLANSLPLKWKTYLHPILLSSGTTILGIWLFALAHSSTLSSALQSYSTGSTYRTLWSPSPSPAPPPGAGDLLSSLISISIISLALPMYHHRHDLFHSLPLILLPTLALSFLTLFAYPPLCNSLLRLPPPSALAFSTRNLTLALSQIAVANLGGNANVGTPLAIFSGIFGVLGGNYLLKKLRVPEEDYITRGISLGANSSSLATAMLLTSDPRAAAFSSLSMGLFGTMVVGLTSVPPLVGVVRGLVGL